jgi:hypothetical protein
VPLQYSFLVINKPSMNYTYLKSITKCSYWLFGDFSDYGPWRTDSIHRKTCSAAWPITIAPCHFGEIGTRATTYGTSGTSTFRLGVRKLDFGICGSFLPL